MWCITAVNSLSNANVRGVLTSTTDASVRVQFQSSTHPPTTSALVNWAITVVPNSGPISLDDEWVPVSVCNNAQARYALCKKVSALDAMALNSKTPMDAYTAYIHARTVKYICTDDADLAVYDMAHVFPQSFDIFLRIRNVYKTRDCVTAFFSNNSETWQLLCNTACSGESGKLRVSLPHAGLCIIPYQSPEICAEWDEYRRAYCEHGEFPRVSDRLCELRLVSAEGVPHFHHVLFARRAIDDRADAEALPVHASHAASKMYVDGASDLYIFDGHELVIVKDIETQAPMLMSVQDSTRRFAVSHVLVAENRFDRISAVPISLAHQMSGYTALRLLSPGADYDKTWNRTALLMAAQLCKHLNVDTPGGTFECLRRCLA